MRWSRPMEAKVRCFRTLGIGRRACGACSVGAVVAVGLLAGPGLAAVPARSASPAIATAHYAGVTAQGRQVAIEPEAGAETMLLRTEAGARCPKYPEDDLVEWITVADVPLARDGTFSAVAQIPNQYAAIRARFGGRFRPGGGVRGWLRLRSRGLNPEYQCHSGRVRFRARAAPEATGVFGAVRPLIGRGGRCGAASAGCWQSPLISEPRSLVASRDGRHVYLRTYTGALVGFERVGGGLRRIPGRGGCLAHRRRPGCILLPGFVNDEVALTADGRHIYASAARRAQAIHMFLRDPRSGKLSEPEGAQRCVGPDVGCDPAGIPAGFKLDSRIVMAPDGRHLYDQFLGTRAADGTRDSGILWLARDPGTGRLAFAGCLSEVGRDGCGTGDVRDCCGGELSVPTRRSAYVSDQFIAALRRDPTTGTLTPLSGPGACVSYGPRRGCARLRVTDAAFFESLRVSPDGKNLYADADDSLITLVRDPANGRIRQLRGAAGCLSQDARHGCRPARGISTISDLAVSRDGRNVYAADEDEQSLLVFARDRRDGSLLQLKARAGCISSLTRDALAASGILNSCRPHVTALGPVVGLAIAPSDDRLYVASRRPGRLLTFARGHR